MIMMKQLFFLRGNQQYRTTWTHRVKWTNCSVSRLSSHGFLNLLANAILLLPRMGELTTRSLLPWWRITALRLFQIDGACFNGLLHLLWKLSEIFHGLCNCWGEQYLLQMEFCQASMLTFHTWTGCLSPRVPFSMNVWWFFSGASLFYHLILQFCHVSIHNGVCLLVKVSCPCNFYVRKGLVKQF